ncbi:MAG: ABC transporter permease [Cyclobacteriaceae bacterium]
MSNNPRHLKAGLAILEWFCSYDHIDMVSGDVLELYHERKSRVGSFRATLLFYRDCLAVIAPMLTKGKSEFYLNNFSMLKNYFIVAFRALSRNKGYAMINILGLAMALAGTLLIYQYIITERAYDAHLDENLVRVTSEWHQDGQFLEHRAAAVPALEQLFKTDYPEVEGYTRYHKGSPNIVRYIDGDDREVKFEETNIYYADPSFVSLFGIEFIEGNEDRSLIGPNHVIITEETAKKFFGSTSPIGKTLKFNGEFDFSCEVTGVIKDIDKGSHLAGDFIISLETKVAMVPFEVYDNWIWRSFYTYLKLAPGTQLQAFEEKMNEGVKRKNGNFYEARGYEVRFHVQPVADIHLQSQLFEEMEVNGNAQTIKYLFAASLFLLSIALVNYTNLTTAKNLYRGKEVGIRKVAGAFRLNLTIQYLMESLVVFAFAVILALVLVYLSLPLLPSFLDLSVSDSLFTSPLFWCLVVGVWFVGGVVSGLYPAIILTALKPMQVLKGDFKNNTSNLLLRKVLVTFQVCISLGLASGVAIILHQVDFMRSRDLGVSKDNVLVINGPKVKDERYASLLETFKTSLEARQDVSSFSTVSSLVGEVTGAGRDFRNEEGVSQFLRIIRVHYDFDQVMGLATVEGNPFSRSTPALDSGLVLNEAAVKQLGFASPAQALNSRLNWRNVGGEIQSPITGVVADYYPNAQSDAVPTVFILNKTYNAPWDPEFYVVSFSSPNMESTTSMVRDVERLWLDLFPSDPFNHYFLNSFYDRQFRSDVVFSRILTLFGGVALALSCIGILALASFTNYMRKKEIGIRKVLGCSETGVLKLVLTDYVLVVGIASVMTLPVIYFIFQGWLANFSYRIDVGLIHLLAPAITLLCLIVTIVAVQSVRTIRTDPAIVLRSE